MRKERCYHEKWATKGRQAVYEKTISLLRVNDANITRKRAVKCKLGHS